MKLHNKTIPIASLKIPFLQRFILLLVDYFSEDEYCELSNNELSEILHRDISKISKAISILTDQNFLIRDVLDGNRILALGEIAKPAIIINNKLKDNNININYSLLINKDNNIVFNDCEKIADYLLYDGNIISFEHEAVEFYLNSYVKHSSVVGKIKTSVQLRMLLSSILRGAIKNNEFPLTTACESEATFNMLCNFIRKLCGFNKLEDQVDEVELRRNILRDRNERRLRKGIIESYKEKTIDISENPEKLQESFKGKKLVSITAELHQLYTAGKTTLYYNLILKTPFTKDYIYVSILEKHVKKIGSKLKQHKGKVKVAGMVYSSGFHHEKFGVNNIIRSIDEFEAVEIIEDLPLLDTALLTPDEDAPF